MSGRQTMPARRPADRARLRHLRDGGASAVEIDVAVGLVPAVGDAPARIGEVFVTLPQQATSEMAALATDAAVTISIALQRGASCAELAKSMGRRGAPGALTGAGGPASLVGTVVDHLVALEAEMAASEGGS